MENMNKCGLDNMSNEIVYFELNNWFEGRDYPPIDFVEELIDSKLKNTEWCKENKLCVLFGNYDMSLNWCVTAPKEWVEKNLLQFLSNDTYTYDVWHHSVNDDKRVTYIKKFSDFVRQPDEDGEIIGQFDWPFLEYREENFGITYCNDYGEIEDD